MQSYRVESDQYLTLRYKCALVGQEFYISVTLSPKYYHREVVLCIIPWYYQVCVIALCRHDFALTEIGDTH